jgi:uncharacterized membrane protein YccC
MNIFEFLVVAVPVVGFVAVKIVDKLVWSSRRAGEAQLQMAEHHAQELLVRMSELERHNDELRQQLEWNRRMLEAQDRLLQQLPPPSASTRTEGTGPPPLSRV